MRRNILPMAIALSAMYMSIAACNGTGQEKSDKDSSLVSLQGASTQQAAGVQADAVPYVVAENYFVNNSVKDSIPVKITTRAVFDTYFGKATTMGSSGTPTPIDFDRAYVIALDHPTTNKKTEIIPMSLTRSDGKIIFNYREKQGDTLGFSIHPLLLLVVDNQYNGELVLHKH